MNSGSSGFNKSPLHYVERAFVVFMGNEKNKSNFGCDFRAVLTNNIFLVFGLNLQHGSTFHSEIQILGYTQGESP